MRQISRTILTLLVSALSACGAQSDPGGVDAGRGQALVITSDYQDGSYALIDMTDFSVHSNIARIHPDAVCRYDPVTRTPFVISRMGADAIEVIDPEQGWRITTEYTVGTSSNPQDLAVVNAERAYVLRYGDPELLVVHPTLGTELDRLDLGQYADGDGVPEASWALVHAGQVFVAIQRLTDFQPSDYSSLLVVDGNSGAVQREIHLSATNPFAPMRYVPSLNRLAVVEAGLVGQLDGGLELLSPDAQGPTGLAVSEEALGGDLIDAVVVDANQAYAVIAVARPDNSMSTTVVRFNPSSGQREAVLLEAGDFAHSYMALSPDRNQLWITERTRQAPGVRIFSVIDDRELTTTPIDTGLPPYMICFVPNE